MIIKYLKYQKFGDFSLWKLSKERQAYFETPSLGVKLWANFAKLFVPSLSWSQDKISSQVKLKNVKF